MRHTAPLELMREQEPGIDPAAALLNYWEEQRQGRAMPTVRDIDPTEILGLLPQLILWDVTPAAGLRLRMAGLQIVSAAGLYMPGNGHEEIGPLLLALTDQWGDLAAVVATGRPYRRRGVLTSASGDMQPYVSVALPLSDTRGSVTMVMDLLHLLPVVAIEQRYLI